jgi:hypothetical protein
LSNISRGGSMRADEPARACCTNDGSEARGSRDPEGNGGCDGDAGLRGGDDGDGLRCASGDINGSATGRRDGPVAPGGIEGSPGTGEFGVATRAIAGLAAAGSMIVGDDAGTRGGVPVRAIAMLSLMRCSDPRIGGSAFGGSCHCAGVFLPDGFGVVGIRRLPDDAAAGTPASVGCTLGADGRFAGSTFGTASRNPDVRIPGYDARGIGSAGTFCGAPESLARRGIAPDGRTSVRMASFVGASPRSYAASASRYAATSGVGPG